VDQVLLDKPLMTGVSESIPSSREAALINSWDLTPSVSKPSDKYNENKENQREILK
jgi:hypothetical protein